MSHDGNYGLLGLAAGLFALIARLAHRSEETQTEGLITAITAIALMAAILFGAVAWFAWQEASVSGSSIRT